MTGITYQTTAEDAVSRSLQITVATDHLAETERRAIREYARKARLPGFRKGHAPEAVVRRKFDSDIRRFILEESLRESWDTILKESNLKPLTDPQVRNVTWESGQPLTFDMLIEIRPELTMGTTGGFSLTRTMPIVTDAMVDEKLQELREQRGTWTPMGDVKPKPGNLVSVTVTSLADGAVETEGKPHDLILGQGQAIPELEEQVMQLQPGQSIETDVRFPDDHPDEQRRGQSRKVRLALHEVKEQVLPDLDDTLARELGDFDSLDALRSRVKEDLESDTRREADAAVRSELIQKLAEANQVPAPPSMVHRMLHAFAENYRINQEQFETFATNFRPIAESQVRRELVLDAVATAQNLRASEAEIDERVALLAAGRNVEPGKLYASLQQGGRLAELEHSITEEKVFAWLLQQSQVHEVSA